MSHPEFLKGGGEGGYGMSCVPLMEPEHVVNFRGA